MSEYIVISAMGSDKPGIVEKMTGLAKNNRCNLLDSKMSQMGSEFVLMMMLNGQKEDILSFSEQLPALADSLGLVTQTKQTSHTGQNLGYQLFNVKVSALDHPGIVHNVTRYFSEHHINVASLNTRISNAPHTGAPVFTLDMTIQAPVDTDQDKISEAFSDFCADYDLEGQMTPA